MEPLVIDTDKLPMVPHPAASFEPETADQPEVSSPRWEEFLWRQEQYFAD